MDNVAAMFKANYLEITTDTEAESQQIVNFLRIHQNYPHPEYPAATPSLATRKPGVKYLFQSSTFTRDYSNSLPFFHIPRSTNDFTPRLGLLISKLPQLLMISIFKFFLQLISEDIESNPGPKLTIASYNVRGCNNYSKLKLLTAYVYSNFNRDRVIFSFLESHVDHNKEKLISMLWRGGNIISPGMGNARGVLTLFSSNLFDSVLLSSSTDDGRSTWLIGTHNNSTEMFITLYAPNSGKNLKFYRAFFNKLNCYKDRFDVGNVYICGDLNIVLNSGTSAGRKNTRYESKLVRYFEDQLMKLNLGNLMTINSKRHTWSRQGILSFLDYILGPKHLVNLQPYSDVKWGIHKSDYACICVQIEDKTDRGRGMLRPNLAFLNCLKLKSEFINDHNEAVNNTPHDWDPHKKFEFAKVMLRTIVSEYSNKYRKQNSDHINAVRTEIDSLNLVKFNLITNGSAPVLSHKLLRLDADLDILNLRLDELLTVQTRLLAQKSRVKWVRSRISIF